MIQGLFGSKSVERILFFLFVNERLYPTQLSRMLGVPLTPLQKALTRLEKDGIVISSLEGKNRIYTFNPSYSLLHELEALLNKAYMKLAPIQKKEYVFIREMPKPNKVLLESVWKRLKNTTRVTFRFHARNKWGGEGAGEVDANYDGKSQIVFQEKGSWRNEQQEFSFRNVFRWTLDRIDCRLMLEHLRFGEKNPIFLFYLVPAGEGRLESLHAHQCGDDTYFGQILLESSLLSLTWRILGPKKNDEVCYLYS